MFSDPVSFASTPGAHLTPDGVYFTVFSRHAQRRGPVPLRSSPALAHETARIRLTRGERDLWHAFVPGAKAGQLYGLPPAGPWMPPALRYNAHKLLLDPYALAIVGKPDGPPCSARQAQPPFLARMTMAPKPSNPPSSMVAMIETTSCARFVAG